MARYPGLLMNPNIAPRVANIRRSREAPLLAQFQGGTQAARIPAPRPIQMAADNSLGQGLSSLGQSLSAIGKMNREKAAADALSAMYVPATEVTADMTGPEAMAVTPTANQLMKFGFANINTPAGKQALLQAQNLATIDANRATRAFELQKQDRRFAFDKEQQDRRIAGDLAKETVKQSYVGSGNKTLDAYTSLFTKPNKTAPDRARLAALRAQLQLPKQIGTDIKGRPLFSTPLNMDNVDRSMREALGSVQAALPNANQGVTNNVAPPAPMIPTQNVNIGAGPGLALPAPSLGEPIVQQGGGVTTAPQPAAGPAQVQQGGGQTADTATAPTVEQPSTQDEGVVSILNPSDVDPEVSVVKSPELYQKAVARNKELKDEISAGKRALKSLLRARKLSSSMFSGTPGAIGDFVSDMLGNVGLPEFPGAVDAKEFDVLMKQQILPGLRQFFGAAFSAFEARIGLELGASKDMPPVKRLRLIDNAIADIQRNFDEKASELARVNKGEFLTEGVTVNKMSLKPQEIERLDADGVKQMFAIREFLTPKQIMALEKAARKR